ncbi:MAG: phosphate signaling complex protein PhoU [Spirochaetales bacterium]|jgi:phosphate transport system protein|nr:phosphate signaling complex protein PhoU [Spirochaetales bacterium]
MPIRQRFLESLNTINQDVLKMGTLVEEAIRKSMQALKDQDAELANAVIDADKEINELELSIQDKCIILIATEQPVAGDLRGLITIIKIVTQLERMGDHAIHVAKGALRFSDEPYMKKLVDLPRMADIAIKMIHEVLTAFMNNDQEMAVSVAAMDDEIDELHNQVTRECLTYMMQDPKHIEQATSFLFISRFLERLGDHATNICEWICYNITGKHRELNQ